MQAISLDHIDRRILEILQTEPGVNATTIGERIGLSQSACWRRIQSLRDEGVIKEQTVRLDREVHNRLAAYLVSVQRVAQTMQFRGWV